MDLHSLSNGALYWNLAQSLLQIELEKLAADLSWAVGYRVTELQDSAVWRVVVGSKHVPTPHPALTRYLNGTDLEPTKSTPEVDYAGPYNPV